MVAVGDADFVSGEPAKMDVEGKSWGLYLGT